MTPCAGPHWPLPPPEARFRSVKPREWNLCADCAYAAFLGGAHIVPLPVQSLRPAAQTSEVIGHE